jgi:hypothetical protein
MPDLDLNSLIEQIAQGMIARLDSLGLSPEEYQSDSNVLIQFAGIAAGQLSQEPGLEGPDPNQPIPLDDNMLVQGLTLFCEGLYDALAKCAHMGIGGTIKQEMIQSLALHIYDQAKQLVAATYGQEHTPEFQFTMEQQIDIIHKATEGYLMALVTEYENINGPIASNEFPALPNLPPMASAGGSPQRAAPAANPQKTKGPTPHDKYAAVALLLTTMPAGQRNRILTAFSEEEKELITYYSFPQHVEQNLDLACVEAHLIKLRESLKKSGPAAKSEAYKGIMALVESNPAEKLLSWVKDERPLVKRYLQGHYAPQPGQAQAQPEGHSAPPDPLPSRIEEILYRHLAKRVNAD